MTGAARGKSGGEGHACEAGNRRGLRVGFSTGFNRANTRRYGPSAGWMPPGWNCAARGWIAWDTAQEAGYSSKFLTHVHGTDTETACPNRTIC